MMFTKEEIDIIKTALRDRADSLNTSMTWIDNYPNKELKEHAISEMRAERSGTLQLLLKILTEENGDANRKQENAEGSP
jgi:ABC-type uncharacterized transport system YnjBCD permease subunit